MIVNVLPVLTYRWLHLNDSELDDKYINVTDTVSPAPIALPAGVSRTTLSRSEAEKVFDNAAQLLAKEDEKYVSPNGDMYFRNKEQKIHTGMGIDIDKLLDKMNVQTDVYTAEENKKISEPVVIRYELEDGSGSLSSQIIHAKKNSEITVILDYRSEINAGGFHGVSTKLLAEEGAKINLIKVQMLGYNYIHIDDIGAVCMKNADIEDTQLELGSSKSWNGIYVNLLGDESVFNGNIGYLCKDEQNYDINYIAQQNGKRTDSKCVCRGVLIDKASKTFKGTIDFRVGSSGSVGDEQEDTLLLSPDVINRTMPVILCQEEDVDGRHGATIGQLDEDTLFYMQSRGISSEQAKKIVVKARLDSIANMIPDDEVKAKAAHFIQNAL
ncbi:MAG: SufD family Fe-S cluster assembly protein [Butyrivibrio sp.]|nr:SufD family Fe-S cluster assembly protein [Butyrivibrio sp.]